ncbi:hypothetical protein acsn021_35510 [Anaerocolumna cellulosilytica]|uniref:Uncharacterized protein n=1 Tax=Anaerocolumna cellulosilytica TaxID=433286 RepID=A0A6S6R9N2_9FIRM|nr:hypothetical protein acsn021_35510 [Anaerocolumna cellulosilytica]
MGYGKTPSFDALTVHRTIYKESLRQYVVVMVQYRLKQMGVYVKTLLVGNGVDIQILGTNIYHLI